MAIAMVKVTFTLDETTVERLNQVAVARSIPKSQAVREAIESYSDNADRMSESERKHKLQVLKKYMSMPVTRTKEDVKRELKELRNSRRTGWQRPSDLR
ncbi:MAG: ribbon-helix-helix protein, CopG family [Acidobacteriota bacterium]